MTTFFEKLSVLNCLKDENDAVMWVFKNLISPLQMWLDITGRL